MVTTRGSGRPAAGAHPANGRGTKDSEPGRRKALVVAINDYGGPPNDLPSCLKDARAFIDVLKSGYGFREANIQTLFDGHATAAAVNAGLDWLAQDARPEDRLVFYYSGHGFTQTTNGRMEEFLVLRDTSGFAFYQDDTLSARTQGLPAGVLTVVLDSCFSGGMLKRVLNPDGTIEQAQNKGFAPLPGMIIKGVTPEGPTKQARLPTAYKHFGGPSLRGRASLDKIFRLPAPPAGTAKSTFLAEKAAEDETGQTELKGLLVSACLETETASASTSKTRGLSAFTYALLDGLKSTGTNASSLTVYEAAAQVLDTAGFRQTPLILAPASPADLKSRSFILLETAAPSVVTAPRPSPTPDQPDWLAELMRQLMETFRHKTVETQPAEPLEELARAIAIESLADADAAATGGTKEVDLGDAVSDGDAQEKFLGAMLGVVIPQVVSAVVPEIVRLASARRKGMLDADLDAEAEQKFLGGILASVVPAVVSTVVPEVIRAFTRRQKDFGIEIGDEEAQKLFGSVLRAVIPTVVSTVVPGVLRALAGRRKDLDLDTEAEQKFLGGVLGAVVPMVVSTVVPEVIRMFARRKDFGADLETQEKFLSGMLGVVLPALVSTVPDVIRVLTEQQKDVGAMLDNDASQQKFLGDVLRAVLPAVASTVVPEVLRLLASRHKALAIELGAEEQEKLFGALRVAMPRIVRQTVPVLLEAVIRAAAGPGKAAEATAAPSAAEKEVMPLKARTRAA